MSTAEQQRVLELLQGMSRRGLESAKQLIWGELNYDRVDEPLSARTWPDSAQRLIEGNPVLFARGGTEDSPFDVVYTRLSASQKGRSFPLSISAERAVVNQLLRDHPYALFLFSDPKEQHWHWVNARPPTLKPTEHKAAPPVLRRIAVGPHERLRTAAERIQMLDLVGPQGRLIPPSPLEIQKAHDAAFDVEAVTKEFYEAYKQVFTALQGNLERQHRDKVWAHDYALQFLNRLMFLYYVQRKRWLGGDPDFLADYWKSYGSAQGGSDRFVSDWLNVLFFEAFNHRFQAGRSDHRHLPTKFREALATAPWLNGGLFSETHLDREFTPQIKDRQFAPIWELFEHYNFTISEETPLDQEVAVDPEMIGRVYESLVNVSDDVDERSEAGIFYTPRVEIDLMCRLSLVDWLSNHLGEAHRSHLYEAVFAFDAEDKQTADDKLAGEGLWPSLDSLLRSVTVLDPACGSGSFLVGMLNVLDDLLARSGARLGRVETGFERKNRIVRSGLYGVDVKEWAIHVAELRLWLQLVIEGELTPEERQLTPLLPNLTFKLRVGDSLVQEVGGINMASRRGTADISPALKGRITQLQNQKLAYYGGSSTDKTGAELKLRGEELALFRDILQDRIKGLQEKVKPLDQTLHRQGDFFGEQRLMKSEVDPVTAEAQRAQLQSQADEATEARRALIGIKDVPFVWDIAFVEVLQGERRGFDIVVGNPPYVRQESIRDPREGDKEAKPEAKKAYKAKLARSVYGLWPLHFGFNAVTGEPKRKLDAKGDLYIYFYFHGLSLLADKGSFCFITSNSWLDVGYGADLQEFLLTKGQVKLIIDNKKRRSFQNADINTVIVLLAKPVDAARPRPESLAHTARFVMAGVPFEEVLSPVVWDEATACQERCIRPEHRTLPLLQSTLLANGMDPEKGLYAGDKWGGKYLRAPDIYWTILEKGKGKLVRLGDIAEVRRGVTTGANEFFYLDAERIAQWGIEKEFLRPVVKSPKECKRIVIDPRELKFKVFMCHKDRRELKGTAALEYIKWGEQSRKDHNGDEVGRFHERPSCRGRPRWWDLGPRVRTSHVWQKSVNDRHIQSQLAVPCLVDQRLYEVECRGDADMLTASLNCALLFLNKELEGRVNLGEGALDTAVYESMRVMIPDPALLPSSDLTPIVSTLARRDAVPVIEELRQADHRALDDSIADMLGLTPGERDAVYEAVIDLVRNRIERAGSVRRPSASGSELEND